MPSQQPTIEQLREVINSIDLYSQEGFSKIGAISRLTLSALNSSSPSIRQKEDIQAALRAICGIADTVENCINAEAETVECNHINGENFYKPNSDLNGGIHNEQLN
ncbi:MAG: hypothetical protein OEX19_04035 [Gammaproteobacteria bacterium]|nr:hypothetical protein [Gammaproteobacteria bacterium]